MQSVAEAAEDIWDRYGYGFGTDYSGLFRALSHDHYNVRLAAAEALAAALDENPDTIQVTMMKFFIALALLFYLILFDRAVLFSNFLQLFSGITFYFIFSVHPGCWFWWG